MLSINALRMAVATAAYAFLLAPELSVAVTIRLDGENEGAPQPLLYAIETFAESTPVDNKKAYHLKSPGGPGSEELKLAVSTKRRIHNRETVFVRLELHGGLVFKAGADPSLEVIGLVSDGVIQGTSMSFDERVQGGTAGISQVVFRINVPRSDLGTGDFVVIDLTDDLAVIGEVGTYAAEISAHSDPDDAIEGIQVLGTLFDARADIIELTKGLDVHIFEVSPAIAEVTTGYLAFVGKSGRPSVVGQAKLGWVRVAPRNIDEDVEILNASTGEEIQADDLVAQDGVTIEVRGNLSIGAFRFIDDTINAAGARSATCSGANASATQPDRGSLVDDSGELLVGETGAVSGATIGSSGKLGAHAAGDLKVYSLCVNVDVLGRETNTRPIPNEVYTGTVKITGAAPGADPIQVGTASVGHVVRNGTAVKLAYLTVSEKYDQRLVIINHGFTPGPVCAW